MKIVQISGAYTGAQRIIEDAIHKRLLALGDESYIFYTYGESSDPRVICYETGLENKIRRGLWKLSGKCCHSACLSTARLIRHIKRIRPDLVHLHVIHHNYTDYPMLLRFLQKAGIPVVYTMHDMWAFTGGCYHYADIGCEGYGEGCTACPQKASQLDCRPQETGRHFDRKKQLLSQIENLCFVSVSSWVADEVAKTHLARYPQYTVWNAVSVASETIGKATHDDSAPFRILGVAAVWTEQKGISLFFSLASLLGDGFEICLVGEASDAIKQKAPAGVTFLGRISDRVALAEQYAAADLHLCLSQTETFGMTLVEAALAGTRSMGFDSTAIPHVLEKVKGFVLPAGDVDAVAHHVRRLATTRELCRLTDDEIHQIRSVFSVEKMAESYLDIYKERIFHDK